MTRVTSAIDGARAIRVEEMGGQPIAQVWHGGVTVNVYAVEGSYDWQEIDCWTLHDAEGRAPDRNEIEKRMGQHFELMEERRR